MGHAPADSGLAFNEDDLVSGIGDVQGGLDARNTSADDQGLLRHGHLLREERLVAGHLGHRHSYQVDGLLGGIIFGIRMNPAAVFPQVGDLHQVRIQSGGGHGLAERILVHPRRAGGDDHPVQAVVLDGISNGSLPGFAAVVFVLFNVGHHRHPFGRLDDLGNVHRSGDIGAAVADEDSNPGHCLSTLLPR